MGLLLGAIGSSSTPLQGYLAYDPVRAPLLPAGATHNWNFPGLSTAILIYFRGVAGSQVSGIIGGVVGRELIFQNVGATAVVFLNQNAGSLAPNRLRPTNGANLSHAANRIISWLYDSDALLWRQMG